ncbi:Uncharacterised protein [Klebsiella pneumoniae]|nr:Uncharacterised protein [Klebsiella pneumoniae]
MMMFDIRKLTVIQPGPAQTFIIPGKPQRMDQM